jgi:MFS family permease
MSNKAEASASASGGIGVVGLLGVAFVVLKLAHIIDWSWVWVLAPFWIGAVAGFFVLLMVVVFILVKAFKEVK